MIPPSRHFIEALEHRIAPAGLVLAVFDNATGKLTLTGDALDNIVVVFSTGPGAFRVEGTGTDIDAPLQPFKDFAGTLASVAIDAGADVDSFTLRNLLSLKDVTFNGGAGDDSLDLIHVATKSAVTVNFDADGGSLGVGGGSSIGGDLTVNYGAGGGTVALFGTSATVKGAVALNGGAGPDQFSVGADVATIAKGVKFMAGAGINDIFFTGGVATVGKGATGNAIEFTGGADANTLTIANLSMNVKGNVAFTGGADVDTLDIGPTALKLDGTLTATLAGAADVASIAPAIGTIKGAVNLNMGEGDGNTVTIAPVNLVFGSSLTVTGGALKDSIAVQGGGSVSVKGAVMLDLGGGSGVSPNDVSLDSRLISLGSSLTIKGTATSELMLSSVAVSLSVKGIVDVEPFGGATMINLDANQTSLGGLTVKTGDGADNIEMSSAILKVAGAVQIDTGDEVDTVTVSAGTMDIKGGVTIDTGDSADIVNIMGDGSIKGDVTIDLGAGDDGVSFADIAGNSGIAGNLKLGGKLTISSAATDTGMLGLFDEMTLRDITVAKAITINLGIVKSDVTIDNLIAKDIFTLNTGGGDDDVKIEQGSLFGPSVFSKMATINLGDDNDTFRAGISSAIGSSSFAKFLGILSIDGGTGTDGSNDFLNAATNFFAPGILGVSLRSNFEGPFI